MPRPPSLSTRIPIITACSDKATTVGQLARELGRDASTTRQNARRMATDGLLAKSTVDGQEAYRATRKGSKLLAVQAPVEDASDTSPAVATLRAGLTLVLLGDHLGATADTLVHEQIVAGAIIWAARLHGRMRWLVATVDTERAELLERHLGAGDSVSALVDRIVSDPRVGHLALPATTGP
jgi:hypothetical protein